MHVDLLQAHTYVCVHVHVTQVSKKNVWPETYESKGHAGHRRFGDGAPPTPVRGHQVAPKHHRWALEKGGWAELGKQHLILAHHVSAVSPGHYLLVVPVVLYHFSTAQPIGRRCHCRGSSTPQSSCPAAASSLLGGGSRPGPAGIGPNGQPKWRPESFFSFLRCEVEIPRRREVEIPLRTRRLWLRPHYEEVPAQPTFRAFSRPKWRGCSPFSFFGYIHVSVDLA